MKDSSTSFSNYEVLDFLSFYCDSPKMIESLLVSRMSKKLVVKALIYTFFFKNIFKIENTLHILTNYF